MKEPTIHKQQMQNNMTPHDRKLEHEKGLQQNWGDRTRRHMSTDLPSHVPTHCECVYTQQEVPLNT